MVFNPPKKDQKLTNISKAQIKFKKFEFIFINHRNSLSVLAILISMHHFVIHPISQLLFLMKKVNTLFTFTHCRLKIKIFMKIFFQFTQKPFKMKNKVKCENSSSHFFARFSTTKCPTIFTKKDEIRNGDKCTPSITHFIDLNNEM